MKLLNSFFIPSLTLLVLIQLSCSPSLQNLDNAKQEVARYYESGEYERELIDIVNDAKVKFSQLKAVPNSVVIFDIDETTLNNYTEIKRIGFGYESKLWDAWINRAEAPAIPQVKDLYNFLLQKGFKIIFITGKKEYHYDATLKNMLAAGYTSFDTIITRNKEEFSLKSAEFKLKKRKELTDKGYSIVGCVGDQFSDCAGGNCGIIVKLPNYLYLVE